MNNKRIKERLDDLLYDEYGNSTLILESIIYALMFIGGLIIMFN